jgi:hypothetical protein
VGWGIALALAAVALAPRGFAEEARGLRGEIVDPAAYLQDGSRGSGMVNQTFEALDGGQTLAFLEDETDTLYLLLAEEPGEDPNELVYDYVNQRLTVTGTMYERSGLKGIVIQSAEPLAAADTIPPPAAGGGAAAAQPRAAIRQ